MTTALDLYKALLENPGDAQRMLILGDALEDLGFLELASAYRWAAVRGRWPFRRQDRVARKVRAGLEVWDWDHLRTRAGGTESNNLPEWCHLPDELFRKIMFLEGREYGDVNQAFILLAHALAGKKKYEAMKPW